MKRTMTEEQRAAKREYMRVYMQSYMAKNKDRVKAQRKAKRDADPEKRWAQQRAYKAANRDKVRLAARDYYAATKVTRREAMRVNWTKQNRKRPFLVLARYETLLGRTKPDICDACAGNDGGIVFDHCHERGHPRGWLCDRCNVALGCLRDDRDRLRKLIAYLDRTEGGTSPQLALSGI
jgi:hypothetical protein